MNKIAKEHISKAVEILNKTKVKKDKEYITQAAFAKSKNVSREYIFKLVKQGKLTIDPIKKKLELEQANIDYEKNRLIETTATEEGATTKISYQDAMAAKAVVETELKKIDLLREQKKIVYKSDVENDAFKIASTLKDALLSMPSRISNELANETDQRIIIELLTNEIKQTLNNIINELNKQKEIKDV